MVYVGFALLIVPQFLSNFTTILQEMATNHKSQKRGKEINKGGRGIDGRGEEYTHDLLAEF